MEGPFTPTSRAAGASADQALRVTRTITVPDQMRLARYRRAPELGPRILFFSGGSALRETSSALTDYTHNSIHLITPFDSGGSSAELRSAFPMLSVGDLRNRLMALADQKLHGHPAVYKLFAHRLPTNEAPSVLQAQLEMMLEGSDRLIRDVPSPLRRLIVNYLGVFCEKKPTSFDLRGANIGNLILAGGYLSHDGDMDAVLFLFSKLVEARGIVRPVSDSNLHLLAELSDGSTIVGQHRITSKTEGLESPIANLRLCTDLQKPQIAEVSIDARTEKLIASAELICFPIGSFYTSVLACLLPKGIDQSILKAGCPKVYIPNCGVDLEQRNMSPLDAIHAITKQIAGTSFPHLKPKDCIDIVIVDSKRGSYSGGLNLEEIRNTGIGVLDLPLISDQSSPLIDSNLMCEALLSLV